MKHTALFIVLIVIIIFMVLVENIFRPFVTALYSVIRKETNSTENSGVKDLYKILLSINSALI